MSFPTASSKTLSLAWIAAAACAAGASPDSLMSQTCAPTPAQAIRVGSSSLPIEATTSIGYRVTAFRWDPLLQQRWAIVATCGHPERPAIAVRIPDRSDRVQMLRTERNPAIAHAPETPLPDVHAGDPVRVWRKEATFQIEISGIAQENAAIGRRILVRVLSSNFADGGQTQTLSGVVRGLRDVEIER